MEFLLLYSCLYIGKEEITHRILHFHKLMELHNRAAKQQLQSDVFCRKLHSLYKQKRLFVNQVATVFYIQFYYSYLFLGTMNGNGLLYVSVFRGRFLHCLHLKHSLLLHSILICCVLLISIFVVYGQRKLVAYKFQIGFVALFWHLTSLHLHLNSIFLPTKSLYLLILIYHIHRLSTEFAEVFDYAFV